MAEYIGLSIVPHAFIPERLHVGGRPPSLEAYWRYAASNDACAGVQMHPNAYHLRAIGAEARLVGLGPEVVLQLVECEEPVGKELIVRTYKITMGDKQWKFKHFCISCEDYSVPDKAAFLTLLKEYDAWIRLQVDGGNPNIAAMVHCKAGVGRSGTFVLARTLMCQPPEDATEPKDVLEELRRHRYLVETSKQFAYATELGKSARLPPADDGKSARLPSAEDGKM